MLGADVESDSDIPTAYAGCRPVGAGMTIATTDALIAAYPGQHCHLWRFHINNAKAGGAYHSYWGSTNATGSPGTATYPGASLVWVIPTSATAGAIPFTDPPGGSKSYVACVSAMSTPLTSAITIYDRLAHTGAITPAAS